MSQRKRHLTGFRLTALSVLVGLASLAHAQDDEVREEYAAFGVAMGAGVSGVLEIVITRWSTAEEREMLIKTLVEKGQEETVKALREQKETGFVRTRGGRGMGAFPSVRLHYAYEFHQDGKRQIIIVTDRPIGMREAARSTRSRDYDISALQMELENSGDEEQGQGTLLAAVKLGFDEENKRIEIESLGQQPIRLANIKRQK